MSNAAAPQNDVETDHEYDGIREFDNPLPKWWLMTFYGTVIFAVGYWFYYHTLAAGLLPREALAEEMAAAQKLEDERQAKLEAEGKGTSDEQLLALSRDPEAVRRGQEVFKTNCLACHGDKGQGLVGPNLTDAYWLHGDRLVDNYKVVSAGVIDKGMPAWKPVLGLSKVRDVIAYTATLRGTNAQGKPPQGVLAGGAAPAAPAGADKGAPAGAPPEPAAAPGAPAAPAASPPTP